MIARVLAALLLAIPAAWCIRAALLRMRQREADWRSSLNRYHDNQGEPPRAA